MVSSKRGSESRYRSPSRTFEIPLWRALEGLEDRRPIPPVQYDRLIAFGSKAHEGEAGGPPIFFAGDLGLLHGRCFAVVGARKVSATGAELARKVARDLVSAGCVVVSGLAQGVDTAALTSAVEAGGRAIAVIGTPLDRAYPAENARLQERLYRDHLLLSPFPLGTPVHKANFPHRNKFMAAISEATVIVEASDTSGTLHQATECKPDRLNRWLFISRRVAEDKRLTWPARFIGGARVAVFDTVDDILRVIIGG